MGLHRLSGKLLLALSASLLFLAACNTALPGGPTPPAATGTPAAESTPLPSATPTPEPSPTPPAPLAVLLAPPQADAGLVSQLQPLVEELAGGSGLRFEVQESLNPAELPPGLRVVVALPPASGLADLAAAAPEVQFMAVGMGDLEPAGNLSLLSTAGGRPDQQGFLAGYLAAVTTTDWRVGMIGLAGSEASQAASQGFSNGVIFYCGLCRPSAPPFVAYPALAEVSPGAGLEEQQAAADLLIGQGVSTVYIFPGAGDTGLLEYLAEKEVNFIVGGHTPSGGPTPSDEAPTGLKNRLVASLAADWPATLREAWPQLAGGQGGARLEPALALQEINPDLLSPGRQRLVNEILADLLAGYIATGVETSQ